MADLQSNPLLVNFQSVLLSFRCLMGLFSVVCLIFAQLAGRSGPKGIRRIPGYAKHEPTFADALAGLRRSIWWAILLQRPGNHRGLSKIRRLGPKRCWSASVMLRDRIQKGKSRAEGTVFEVAQGSDAITVSGVATFSNLMLDTPGTYQIKAAVSKYSLSITSATFMVA